MANIFVPQNNNKEERHLRTGSVSSSKSGSKPNSKSISQTQSAEPLERLYIIHHRVNPHREEYEEELETALESRCSVLIIEPETLGNEVLRWITVGNFLHKVSVISGLVGLVASLAAPRRLWAAPFVLTSAISTGIYNISWQFDPASKFQPFSATRHPNKLAQLPLHLLQTSNPVVLIRRNDHARKVLHTTITVSVSGLLLWNLVRTYLSN